MEGSYRRGAEGEIRKRGEGAGLEAGGGCAAAGAGQGGGGEIRPSMGGGGSDGGVGDGHETHSIFSGRSGRKGTDLGEKL